MSKVKFLGALSATLLLASSAFSEDLVFPIHNKQIQY